MRRYMLHNLETAAVDLSTV